MEDIIRLKAEAFDLIAQKERLLTEAHRIQLILNKKDADIKALELKLKPVRPRPTKEQ